MADTQIRLIGPNDLGAGLKEKDMKVVARTIVKQVQINSVAYLLDADGLLLPTEDWAFGGIAFTLMMKGHGRKFVLSDFVFDTAGNTFTLPAGSSVATVEEFVQEGGYPSFSGVDNNPNHPLGLSASSNASGAHITFAKPLTDFPYIKTGMLVYNTIPIDYEPNAVPTPYALGGGFGLFGGVKFDGDFLTWVITNNGVDVVHGPGPYGDIVLEVDRVFPADTIPWADWANPTQAELDAFQDGDPGFFQNVYRPDGNVTPAAYQFPLYFYLMYEQNIQPAA